jgi:hypothetical protein
MKVACTAFVFILFSLPLIAQNDTTVTGNFSGKSFDQIVSGIESHTRYHFYYNPAWTDSLSFQADANENTIHEFLQKLFIRTDLQYTIDENDVYITKGRKLLNELPAGYFDLSEKTNNTPEFDYSDYEKKDRQKKLAETKLYAIGQWTGSLEGTATLSGTVRDASNGELLIGATLYIEKLKLGTSTNSLGYFTITLPRGKHEIKVKSVGMKATQRQVMLYASGNLDIEVEQNVTALKEVVIESKQDARTNSIQMGMEKLDIQSMKQIPLALGETDVMKVVLALPGVQSVGEGTVGLNVRGGATNQNLIRLNEAVVYNPSHFFGFFSTFNPDVLKSVELYKSGIEASYGGRLSSVLDVHTRDGNNKKFSGSGGISPITGRLSIEGPIIKDRTSFVIGGRSTYSDWLLHKLPGKVLRNSKASFYDVTAAVNHRIDSKNNLYLSGYTSRDQFNLNDTTYSYTDQNASLKWKFNVNSKLSGAVTGTGSHYAYAMSSNLVPENAFVMDFDIRQWSTKASFEYFLNAKHTLDAGVEAIHYKLSPGNLNPNHSASLVTTDNLQHERARETAVYLGDHFELTHKLLLYAGARYSFYQLIGPKDIYQYPQNLPRETFTLTDTISYPAKKAIVNYGGFEPRVSLRYLISEKSSFKVSYNRMRQYIQMLSNTTAITPTDIWKLSDPYIKPQVGDQFSAGWYRNLKSNTIETSVEAYYKTMQRTLDYKNNAQLLLNHHLETDIVDAEGKAYGFEFMMKKAAGKLNGWISYTYSRSLVRSKSQFPKEIANHGKWYPSNFDKPHAINFIGNYKFNRRFNFSLNMIYSTGRPITLPIGKFTLQEASRVLYSGRNQYRVPNYFRTDVSINIEGNHKIKKLAHSSWTFAVYNLTGRENVYSVFFTSQDGIIKSYKLSIFAQAIPTITYNFKF